MNVPHYRPAGPGALLRSPVLLSYLACLIFGTAMIVNTQPMGDGAWFWYARLLLQGKHLYSDMHLALQPLYILETAAAQKLLGVGWLIGKVPALFHMAVYLAGLWWLVRRTGWTDAQCAVLLPSVFLVSIQFVAYRFDDYHVATISCQVYSLCLLLVLARVRTDRENLGIAVLLGLLSGLAVTTRINDGGLLFLSVCLAAFFCAPARKLLHVAVLSLAALGTTLGVVLLTGDTVSAWFNNSLLHAAANKGGASSVLLNPLRLPWSAWVYFTGSRENSTGLLYTVLLGSVVTWLLHGLLRSESRTHWRWRVVAVVALLASAHHLIAIHLHGQLTTAICAVIVLVTFVVDAVVLWRLARWIVSREPWDARQLLLLIPTGQLVSGSMSSGGYFIPLYTPIAMEFVMLAVLFPGWWPARSMRRHAFLVVAFLVSFWVIAYKIHIPFSWHSYVEKRMFTDRVWYRHPVYGPMLIEREDLAFMQASCQAIQSSGSKELLSMPFPYLNYFCNIPPWHDYVQTFFDTSGEAVILPLVQDLRQSPPEWVLYQRQLWVLRIHEVTYNHNQPLPHRKIDELLVDKVESGQWKVEQQAPLGYMAQWYLIRTR